MKRFVFPLERVLRFKRQMERLAKMREAKARASADQAAAKLSELHRRLAEFARGLETASQTAQLVGSWSDRMAGAARFEDRITAAERDLALAKKHLREVAQERVKLSVEVEGLEKLRGRALHEYRREMGRHAQAWLDEQVQRIEPGSE